LNKKGNHYEYLRNKRPLQNIYRKQTSEQWYAVSGMDSITAGEAKFCGKNIAKMSEKVR